MNALEQRLHELGREITFPREPDLAAAVLPRARRRPFPWRAAAIALAVLAAALGTAFAVPQARSAILRWFHLGGASVELVDTLPQAEERAQAGGLGRPLPLAEAERQVGFRLLLPPLDARPERVYVIGRSVATVVLRAHGSAVLLSEFPSAGEEALKKLAPRGSTVGPAGIRGEPGLWLTGGPHVLTWIDRDTGYGERPTLVHGNVLLWLHGDLTLRLEGRLAKAQALELARLTR